MRFTTVSSVLSLLCLFETSRADINLLQKRFDIVGPEYVYDEWEFSMDFEVSDFMTDSMIGYALYDGTDCKVGSNDITNNDGYLLSRFRSDNVPEGNGSGTRKIKIQTQVVPSKLVNSGIYREEENGDGIVEYCVRFSNYNMDKDDPEAFEINFLETIVKVSIQFTGDFGVSVYLDPGDIEVEELNEEVALEAYLCDREENIVPVAEFNQGQTVRVCVTPTAEFLARGFRMRQIEDFVYRREMPFSTRQQAIKAGTGGVPADQLTVVSCRPGSVVCAFETLLFADFFVSEGIIAGQGSAFLQIGAGNGNGNSAAGRNLKEKTKLTDGPVGFDLTMAVVPLVEHISLSPTDSSAPIMATSFVTTSLLLAAGLLALFL